MIMAAATIPVFLSPYTSSYQNLLPLAGSNGGNSGGHGLTESLVEMARVAVENTSR